MKHTNLDHEITGSYYEEETDWTAILLTSLCLLAIIAVIGEFTGLTDWAIYTVASWMV